MGAAHYLRPDASLQSGYIDAAPTWAETVGASDRCLGKDSAALLKSNAGAGASELRPGWLDRVTGARQKEYQQLLQAMRFARVEAAVGQDQCMLAASFHGSVQTALLAMRAHLVRVNQENPLLSFGEMPAKEEG